MAQGCDPIIRQAAGAADIAAVGQLFRDYLAELGEDLSYQGVAEELAGLPGAYAPPRGALLIARAQEDGQALGCVALRPLFPPGVCEMKRLHVTPAARGRGIGRALVAAVLAAARQAGYAEIWLDTLQRLEPALGLYRAMGFRPIAPYNDSPLPGTLYLGRAL
ncbi:MAG: GNAT family N-acetyltransferase [Rhodovarius sp.]|nr:GNAT family N-acetyltransferase [Rhodovarius sp.]MCX7933511.1 GNAT family N-acetyltransferase [Rhodovarius sp.]MDW8315987.1 GNAT family N-acetyltransferase [Rhodovarius sp.]